jgi:hypothetical protein
MVNSEELVGITEYLTLYTRCRVNQYRYNRVRLYFLSCLLCPQSTTHAALFFHSSKILNRLILSSKVTWDC